MLTNEKLLFGLLIIILVVTSIPLAKHVSSTFKKKVGKKEVKKEDSDWVQNVLRSYHGKRQQDSDL